MSSILALLAQRRHSEDPGQRSGPDRREWWSRVRPRRRTPSTPGPAGHPLQPLAGASGARFAVCFWVLLEQRAGWVPRYYPPWYTHPVPYPVPVHLPGTTRRPLAGHGTHRGYGQFDTLVGEPRGIRTHPYYGSQTGLWRSRGLTRPFDWF